MRPAAAALGIAIAAAGAACAAPPAAAPAGERLYARCYACHALEPGRNTPAGPTLHAIVGKRIAAEDGFDYSPALRRLAIEHGRWTPALLDRFLADPEAVAPGTEMGFPGLDDPADRRALIRWLDGGASRAGGGRPMRLFAALPLELGGQSVEAGPFPMTRRPRLLRGSAAADEGDVYAR